MRRTPWPSAKTRSPRGKRIPILRWRKNELPHVDHGLASVEVTKWVNFSVSACSIAHGAKKLLAGGSAHIVMGMPAWLYQSFFCGHGIRGLRRSVFRFAGFSPVRTTMFGMIENPSGATKSRWLGTMRKNGAKAR
jgi:hypothetical protein